MSDVLFLVWGYDAWSDSHRLITATRNLALAQEAKAGKKGKFERIYCEAVHDGDLVGELELVR